ncbi:hypothetical protein Tco_1214390 [Tanacetum coccineum]
MKNKSNRKSSAPSPIIKIKTIKKSLTSSSPSLNKTRATDLKKTTSLHIDSIKRSIDCCYSDLLNDIDGSHIRLQKRFQVIHDLVVV